MNKLRYSFIIGKNSQIDPKMVREMHVERKKCFVDKLKWNLETTEGQEVDQFDLDDTIYLIITEQGHHVASLRLNNIREDKSLMSVISKDKIFYEEKIWEMSRFITSNGSFSVCEYLLFSLVFYKLRSLGVKLVHTTLSPSIARLYRMLGLTIEPIDAEMKVSRFADRNFTIDTSAPAFERFCRNSPPHAVNSMRMLEFSIKHTVGGAWTGSYPVSIKECAQPTKSSEPPVESSAECLILEAPGSIGA